MSRLIEQIKQKDACACLLYTSSNCSIIRVSSSQIKIRIFAPGFLMKVYLHTSYHIEFPKMCIRDRNILSDKE